VWQEINHGKEIGGYGHVTKDGDDFLCDKIWLLTTSHGSSSMHITEDKVADFLLERNSEGINIGNLYLQWHSHPKPMTAFFSSTDEKDIREHLKISHHLLPVVFSGPANIIAKYATRSGEIKLKVSLQLSEYYDAYVKRPTESRPIFPPTRHVQSGPVGKRNNNRSGPHRELGSNSIVPDGYWLRGKYVT
jgi:hypothetical protein